jgi:starvation-inducible outer membrane lipoprotein
MKSIVALMALALTGCATARLIPAGVSGNSAYVSVSNVWNEAQALPYATAHCAQFGKVPRFQSKSDAAVVFDCVAQ